MEVGSLFVKLGLNKDNFDRGINGVKGEMSSLGGVFKNAMSSMVGFAMYDIGGKLVSGLKNAVSAGIEYNATLENSRIAWTTLLGTQEKADVMLQRIEKFAATTPFEKMGVDNMAKQLNNAGLQGDALFNQLTKFGDMGGAFGVQQASLEEMVRQYAQVKQAGVAYTEDLNILQDRGIPIYKALAKELNINVADVKKWAGDGKISADIYQKALDGVAKSVEGGMNKQSKSFNGMISNLKDSLSQLGGLMAKDLFAGLSGSLEKLLPIIDGITNAFKDGGFMGVIQKYAPSIMPFIKDLGILIQSTFTQIQGVAQAFQIFWQEHGELIKSIIKVAWDFIMLIIKTTINSIVAVVQSGLSIIDGIIDLFSDLFAGDFSGAWEAVKQIFNSGITFVWNLMNLIFLSKIKGLLAEFKLGATGLIESAWSSIKGIFSGGVSAVTGFVENLVSSASTSFGTLKTFGASVFESLFQVGKTMFSNLLDAVATYVGQIPGAISGFMSEAVSVLKSINLFEIGVNIIQGLINGIKNMGSNVVSAISGIVNNAISAAKSNLGINSPSKVFMEFGGYVGEGLAIGVNNSNDMVKKSMANLNGIVTGVGLNSTKLNSTGTGDSSKEQSTTIEIPVYLDGNVIAKVVHPYLDKIQGNGLRLAERGIV